MVSRSSAPADGAFTPTERLMWSAERDPVLRSAFLNITICDGEIDVDRLRHRLWVSTQDLPRVRSSVAEPGHPFAAPSWVVEDTIDPEYHVRHLALPSPGSDRQLLDLATTMFVAPMDSSRPLWEFTVVHGLTGGRSALLAKLHHAVTDGIGGIRLTAAFVDLEPDAPQPEAPAANGKAPSGESTGPGRSGAIESFSSWLRGPLAAGRSAATTGSALLRHPSELPKAFRTITQTLFETDSARSKLWAKAPRSVGRRLDVLTLHLPDVKAAARALGGTVNDAFVTGVAGGIAAYHRELGVEVAELRLSMPVSTRRDKTAGGNSFVPSRVLVPAGERNLQTRFDGVRSRLGSVKFQSGGGLVATMTELAALAPPVLVSRIARQQTSTVDFAVSNIRGAPMELWIAGAKISHNFPMGPTGGVPVNVTCLSTIDALDVGIVTDTAAVDNPVLLTACIADALAEVVAAGH